MINEEKELSNYIKSVHLSLRCRSRHIGVEATWKQHVHNEEVLSNYAACMKKLAEEYWSVNNKKNGKCLCRIQWMVNILTEYFQRDGISKETSKENKKLEYFLFNGLIDKNEIECVLNVPSITPENKYRVLDVGSCHNPFGSYDFLEVFPIDLWPATPDVKKCDFTRIRIKGLPALEDSVNWFRDNLQALPRNFFSAVIFSLFLEYLPSPEQRYDACQKAYKVLKVNGLLLIATPDSKHESANAGIMKKWKIALARIGFARIKLEKLKYLYCMAYRKSMCNKYPSLLYNVKNFGEEEKIFIPQDFVNYEIEKVVHENFSISEENVREAFQELPFS